MKTNELIEPFERLLADLVTPNEIRRIERDGSAAELWRSLQESGFLDALVPESAGGAGLSLADIAPLLHALGRHLVPVPVAHTMVARALLAQAGLSWPEQRILLTSSSRTAEGWQQQSVAMAAAAEYLLTECGDELILLNRSQFRATSTGVHASQAAHLDWLDPASSAPRLRAPLGGLRPICAVLRAAEIAGACDELLRMAVTYAGQRVQFGKPIGRQQAIQQQLAVMAEQVVMTRIAGQLGCAHGFPPPTEVAAVAKQVTSSAVGAIVSIAHAVHGAIGISEEYDLQLYVRRLHEWRVADGSESYWARIVGAARLASTRHNSVDFLLDRIATGTARERS